MQIRGVRKFARYMFVTAEVNDSVIVFFFFRHPELKDFIIFLSIILHGLPIKKEKENWFGLIEAQLPPTDTSSPTGLYEY